MSLTRSVSYFTLSKQQPHQQFDGLEYHAPSSASASSASATPIASGGRSISNHDARIQQPAPLSSMPRSISMQKLSGSTFGNLKRASSTLHFPLVRQTTTTTTVELVEDVPPACKEEHPVSTSASASIPITRTYELPPSLKLQEVRENATPSPTTTAVNPYTPTLESNSTSPDSFVRAESGSMPIAVSRRPLVGNALVHPPPDRSMSLSNLPAALVEDFDIIGRAGGDGSDDGSSNGTCDSWIVRSKFSGKLAVFKPRDGEGFQERTMHETQEREDRERQERERRRGGCKANSDSIAPVSSSCPHPLSLTTSLRTPLKRGIVYGETTRKEVAAYLMDHEHFAGVPKTLEATLWLKRQDAPNQGLNRHDSGVHNYHPYLHGEKHQGSPNPGLLALTAGSSTNSPEMQASHPGRLLLQAATASPTLGATSSANEPQFSFDAEEMWLPPSAAPDGGEESIASARRSHIGSEEDDYGAQNSYHSPSAAHIKNNNLAPPSLYPASHSPSPAFAPVASTHSPDLSSTAGTTPDEFRGLPSAASELIATYGSLQEFVENKGSAEDMGSNSFAADEVHRIGILDVRLLNLDRHLGNLLVQRDTAGRPHLIPIDHGFILPSYQDLSDVHLEWTFWRQCREPFSKETLRYITRLDPIADAAKLRALGIPDDGLVAMVFSSLLLKHAAAEGLCLFHIAQMVQRDGAGEEPSTLENIVARVLGAQQVDMDASPSAPAPSPMSSDSSSSNSSAFNFATTSSSSDSLPSVEEEYQLPSSSSTRVSRQSSESSNTSTESNGSAKDFTSPASSPPQTPGSNAHASAAPTPILPSSAPMTTLLTRSNSDGAVALAEAITGRQFSAPAPGDPAISTPKETQSASAASASSASASHHLKRPASLPRRQSVADAAKHILSLVDSQHNSPALAPSVPHSRTPPPPVSNLTSPSISISDRTIEHLPTPPPPGMLRLGTELTLHNPDTAQANASGEIPTGAKLQHLLHLTEMVIREELSAYCARNSLTPLSSPNASSTTTNVSSPTAVLSPISAPSTINRPTVVHTTPSPPSSITTSAIFNVNTTVRSPYATLSPSRSASFDSSVASPTQPLTVSNSVNALAALRRSRSSSIDREHASSMTQSVPHVRSGSRTRHLHFESMESRTPPAITVDS